MRTDQMTTVITAIINNTAAYLNVNKSVTRDLLEIPKNWRKLPKKEIIGLYGNVIRLHKEIDWDSLKGKIKPSYTMS